MIKYFIQDNTTQSTDCACVGKQACIAFVSMSFGRATALQRYFQLISTAGQPTAIPALTIKMAMLPYFRLRPLYLDTAILKTEKLAGPHLPSMSISPIPPARQFVSAATGEKLFFTHVVTPVCMQRMMLVLI